MERWIERRSEGGREGGREVEGGMKRGKWLSYLTVDSS